jgi:lipopolysaccharide transport system permease protein/teichoic acid transport system permease protein
MIKSFLYFLRMIYNQRYLVATLAKREIATQYAGSLLGFIWNFLNPVVMVCIYWFVFSVGLKLKPSQNVPFVVWLTAGLTAWYVFADIINGSSVAIAANAHLIKKTLFRSEILPVVKVVACLLSHGIFLAVLIGLLFLQRMPVSMYYLQFFYYLLCLIVLALGLGWAVAALNVFIKDVGPIVNVIIQIGFWGTPIFWDISIMPAAVQTILKLNPMFYVVQGYRESFIYFKPFWQHPYLTVFFWGTTAVVFICGSLIFRKLKPQFADVL